MTWMHKLKYRNHEYLEIRKVVNMTFFISIAIILSVFESFLPISFIIPGVKLGLSNIILVIMIYNYQFKDLLLFQFLKISITTFVLGLFSIYLFSLAGGMLALIAMYSVVKIFKTKITVYSVSIIGAVFHNIGQIVFATIYLKTYAILYYLPWAIIFACMTGFLLGFIIDHVNQPIERKLKDDSIKELFS